MWVNGFHHGETASIMGKRPPIADNAIRKPGAISYAKGIESCRGIFLRILRKVIIWAMAVMAQDTG